MNRRRALLLSLPTLLAALLTLAGSTQAASGPGDLTLKIAVGRSAPLSSALVGSRPLESLITPRVAARGNDRIAVATGVAAEEGATLSRAVGPNELAGLQQLGRYRVSPGGTEGKGFFETPGQASNFARMMGDKPFTTTSARVSPSDLARGDRINPAREGPGYFFRTPDVPSGPVSIFNHSVLP